MAEAKPRRDWNQKRIVNIILPEGNSQTLLLVKSSRRNWTQGNKNPVKTVIISFVLAN